MKVPLAKLADIPENDVAEISFFDRSYLLTRADGVYHAFANVCPHAGGPLEVDDGRLRCPWHEACFSLRNGAREGGPAPHGLIRLPVRPEGDDLVYVWDE